MLHCDDFLLQPHPHALERLVGRQALLGCQVGEARIGAQLGDDGIDRLPRTGEEDVDALGREEDRALETERDAARGKRGLERLAVGERDELVAGNIDDGHDAPFSARAELSRKWRRPAGSAAPPVFDTLPAHLLHSRPMKRPPPPTPSKSKTNFVDPLAEVLRPGQSIELLKELHILTRDGKLNQDSRRKLKQVYHLCNFIEPLIAEVRGRQETLTLADHGAGKSYLGFILYDLFLKERPGAHIYGIETRDELVAKSRELATRLGFERMSFLNATVAESITTDALPAEIDIVTALHACNTATDDAIRFALAKSARHIVLVPCCQAEVAAVLRKNKNASFGKTPLSEIWRHPIHTREFGSQLTNVLRCLQLESHGYQVTVTELVGWEHSLKNELIVATQTGEPRRNARERLAQILQQLNLEELAPRFLDA